MEEEGIKKIEGEKPASFVLVILVYFCLDLPSKRKILEFYVLERAIR